VSIIQIYRQPLLSYVCNDANLINVVDFNIIPPCRSSIVIVSVPLINLTPLQTFSTKKVDVLVEPNLKCVCRIFTNTYSILVGLAINFFISKRKEEKENEEIILIFFSLFFLPILFFRFFSNFFYFFFIYLGKKINFKKNY